MNEFRLAGDIVHLTSILCLMAIIWKAKQCSGISRKTGILFCTVFVTRYMDLFLYFISIYNVTFKIVYILCTSITIFLMYQTFAGKFIDHKYDTLHIEVILITTGFLAAFIHYDFEIFEIFWAFSIYLESVAMLPQIFLFWNKFQNNEFINGHYIFYIFGLLSYRTLYLCNWIYRYWMEDYKDEISIASGIVQIILTAICLIQAIILYRRTLEKPYQLPSTEIKEPLVISVLTLPEDIKKEKDTLKIERY